MFPVARIGRPSFARNVLVRGEEEDDVALLVTDGDDIQEAPEGRTCASTDITKK